VGAYSTPSDPVTALGEGRRRRRDGREAEDMKGEERGKGKGREGGEIEEKKEREGRKGKERAPTFWVKFTPLITL